MHFKQLHAFDFENIDIDTLTPVEALMKLNEIKKYIGKPELKDKKIGLGEVRKHI